MSPRTALRRALTLARGCPACAVANGEIRDLTRDLDGARAAYGAQLRFTGSLVAAGARKDRRIAELEAALAKRDERIKELKAEVASKSDVAIRAAAKALVALKHQVKGRTVHAVAGGAAEGGGEAA